MSQLNDKIVDASQREKNIASLSGSSGVAVAFGPS